MEKRTISVTGEGKVSARPDTIELKLDMTDVCKEYAEALEESARRTQALRECMEAAGLNGDDLRTVNFYVRAEYDTEYVTERENLLKKKMKTEQVLKGYRFSHSLKISFPVDNELLGRVLGELSRSKTGTRFDFNFTVKDPAPLRAALLDDAARVCRANAQTLATASGAELGEVIDINYSWGRLDIYSHPVKLERSRCVAKMAPDEAYSIDVNPENIELEESVTITWALK